MDYSRKAGNAKAPPLKRVTFFISLYIMSIPFYFIKLGRFGSLQKLIIALAAIVCFIMTYTPRRMGYSVHRDKRDVFFVWSVYVVFVVLSVLWHKRLYRGESFIIGQILVYAIMFMFRFEPLDKRDYRAIEKAWIISGLISMFLFLFIGRYEYRDGRNTLMVLGSRADPNEICGFFIVPVGIILYRLFNKRERSTSREIFFILIYVGLSVFVIFKTASRGGIVAMVAALVCSALFSNTKNKRNRVIGVMILAVLTLITLYVIIPSLSSDAQNRLSVQALMDDNGGNRTIIWRNAFFRFKYYKPFIQFFGQGYFGYISTAHNQFIQNLMDLGIIGLAIYVVLTVKAFLVCLRRARSYIPGYVGMFVLSLTLTMTAAYKPLWILLTVLALHFPDDRAYFRRRRRFGRHNEDPEDVYEAEPDDEIVSEPAEVVHRMISGRDASDDDLMTEWLLSDDLTPVRGVSDDYWLELAVSNDENDETFPEFGLSDEDILTELNDMNEDIWSDGKEDDGR